MNDFIVSVLAILFSSDFEKFTKWTWIKFKTHDSVGVFIAKVILIGFLYFIMIHFKRLGIIK